ncbi:MAG: hypothetical protein MJ054_00755, partial [Clostridia bacterium]|nr:hypothetical protein [Clostridia bacterium]
MACQQILSSIFDSAIKKLNSSNSEVNSNSNSAPLFGYVHVLNHGNAIFITDERQSYLISIEYIMLFRLKTGDRLQARVAYSASNDRYIVNEIIHVQHITYDNAPIIKTNQNFNIAENNVGVGTSVLVPVKDNMDIATKVAKIISDLPQDMVPFLLSFDGRPT